MQKNGLKSITINTSGSEKQRISSVLLIIEEGNKLPPLLIFKGKKGKTSAKKLQNIQCIKDRKIFAFYQQNSWCDTELFIR